MREGINYNYSKGSNLAIIVLLSVEISNFNCLS